MRIFNLARMKLLFWACALVVPVVALGYRPEGPVAAIDADAAQAEPEPAWRASHRRLGEKMQTLAADLARSHTALVIRAQHRPELLLRLSPEPQRTLPTGYGVLPEIREHYPDRHAARPQEKMYSLEILALGISASLRDTAVLAGQAGSEAQPLKPLVAEYERLRDSLRNFDEHLAYHAQWQDAVTDRSGYFERQNLIIARLRAIRDWQHGAGADLEAEALSRELRAEIAPFWPTAGLVVEQRGNGTLRLPVTVFTDIGDDRFLAEFCNGVESIFNDSTAARAVDFEVSLRLVRISPATLYPEGRPPENTAIDTDAHLDRFPPGVLVLTTGAADTHAWTGRAIVLGPAPITRRTLAHEFGHLLGFDDAYVRGYDGDPGDPFGVVIVEWTGLTAGLMGESMDGIVTDEMIEQLIASYAGSE